MSLDRRNDMVAIDINLLFINFKMSLDWRNDIVAIDINLLFIKNIKPYKFQTKSISNETSIDSLKIYNVIPTFY